MAKVTNLKLALQGGTTNTLYATWSFNETTSTSSSSNGKAKVGDTVTIKSGSKYYNGSSIPSWVMNDRWIVSEVSGSRAVINKNTSGTHAINSPININNLIPVQSTQTQTKANTLDYYKVQWYYDSGNGTWFDGGSSQAWLKNATYSIPSNAVKVRVSVRPIAKTYTKNNKQVSYWTGTSVQATYIISNSPPERLSAPTVKIEKLKLTASIENIDDAKVDKVQFEVYRNQTKFASGTVSVKTASASYSLSITSGAKYKVRCRAINLVGSTNVYGEWSLYSSEIGTIPQVVTNVACNVESKTSVKVSWTGDSTATGYTVEYTTNKSYFDSSSEVSSISVTNNYAYITGLETGKEWYFRVKATNNEGSSAWSEIVYKIIGTKPDAPTTWSMTTTAVLGEEVILYWVHNSEDGSKQTQAEIELTINEESNIITIDTESDSNDDDAETDKIYSYTVDLSKYPEGAEILWRIRTRGITFEYSDWSVQRTIDVYAPPVASLLLGDGNGILTTFPFNIAVTAGPNTQKAITYHISITAEDSYETQDEIGNDIFVNAGTEVFSKVYTALSNTFSHDLMAEEITLENNQSYTVKVTVSMDSGLTAEATDMFLVSWSDDTYDPDASITFDEDILCAYIIPFCLDPDSNYVENVVLSVYRREFDGGFTEIATDIENDGRTTVTDPHPSLDYARYRIVARNRDTNNNNYVDLPGIPITEPSIVIQWDEKWSKFDYSGEDEAEIPPWTGSMLKLKYNVDIKESTDKDVSLINYIGRENPVSYYGTQKGVGGTWSCSVPKFDKETIYALRKLSVWNGDVYIREPSGNGYPASISVSLSQKHNDQVVPVTIEVKRVEGDK